MDTLIERKQFIIPVRTCETVLTISLFTIFTLTNLIFQPPLWANELLLANNAITTPTLVELSSNIKEEISPEYRKEKFNNRIKNKYQGLKITDVTDGVKHIKMVKYYNGKPVRINIVEVTKKSQTTLKLDLQ